MLAVIIIFVCFQNQNTENDDDCNNKNAHYTWIRAIDFVFLDDFLGKTITMTTTTTTVVVQLMKVRIKNPIHTQHILKWFPKLEFHHFRITWWMLGFFYMACVCVQWLLVHKFNVFVVVVVGRHHRHHQMSNFIIKKKILMIITTPIWIDKTKQKKIENWTKSNDKNQIRMQKNK